MRKTCEVCGDEFDAYRPNNLYCPPATGRDCRAQASRKRARVEVEQERRCITCEQPFTAHRTSTKRCDECRKRDPKWRSREAAIGTPEVELLRHQVTELRTQLRQATVGKGFENALIQRCEHVIQTFPPVPHPKPRSPRKKTVREDAVLLLSDLHIGEYVSVDETGGLGGYTFETFVRRMEHLSDVVRSFLLDTMQGYSFERLHIFGLGDYVSGLIHDELRETNELHEIDQMLYGQLVIAQFLREMAAEFPEVQVSSVVGNHGRTREKKGTKNKATCNFDYAIMCNVATHLRAQPNISFHLPRSFWTIREVRGWKFLNLHGDNIRGWMGIPWYGITRAVARLTELLGAQEQAFDYSCLAHFHQHSTLQGVRGEKIVNGSLIGPSEYGIGLGLASEARQLLFGVHDKHGKTWGLPIEFRQATGEPIRYEADLTRAPHEQIPA